MAKEKYWTSNALEGLKMSAGDEIEFDGDRWIVEIFRHQFGHQRQADTIMYTDIVLVSATTDDDGGRTIKSFELYPQWYVRELRADRRPPEFLYRLIDKEAWARIWVRIETITV